jgi:peptidoglycan/xylan/chitin deacetylase (PgdA/CDA1 family)
MTVLSHERFARRYRRWQQNVLLASPFVIFCGIIAAVFFFYRFVLVLTPLVFLEQAVLPESDANSGIVCNEDEGSHPGNVAPLLSAGYQKRIKEQPATSRNLVANPGLTQVNAESGEPVGYTHAAELRGAHYSYHHGAGPAYLHVDVPEDIPQGKIPPAWVLRPAVIKADATYAYGFYYRSDVPVHVSAEYTVNGKTGYKEVMTLDANTSWQRFEAHFDNTEAATDFRVDISSTKKGYVDSRGFDIHEIASASLKKGIVSVAFDDGWQSVNDKAAGLLAKYGIRTTQYIISDVAAHGVKGYMSYGTIRRLHQEGHEIGSHTLNHCNQTMLSPQAIAANATASKQTLEKEGLGPVKSFAYPLGEYNEKTQAVYEKDYPFVRTSDFGYNDRYFDAANIRSIAVLNTTSDKELGSWLSYAKAHKEWLVLVYHKVDASGSYNVTQAQLEKQLAMIKQSGLTVEPISEAARSIRPSM